MAKPSSVSTYVLRVSPVTIRVRASIPSVAEHIQSFYKQANAQSSHDTFGFIDLDVAVVPGNGFRRFWHPQARFLIDGNEPFIPLPFNQAAPLLEWGLNWVIASRPLGYLTIHAAVVAKGSNALLMPGFPGSGKSTLCASLVFLDEWRLLSDELALLDPSSGNIQPHPRPLNLKNKSIDIVSAYPNARVGPCYTDTRKGTVALAAPPESSITAAETTARCRWVVFPKFVAEGEGWCEEISKAETLALIAEQSFNKDRMGEAGFRALCEMLDSACCYQIGYRSTDEALHLVRSICGISST